MKENFWLPDSPSSSCVPFYEDLEELLLQSLQTNRYSAFNAALTDEGKPSYRAWAYGDHQDMTSCLHHLPDGDPVKERVGYMLRLSGMARRAPLASSDLAQGQGSTDEEEECSSSHGPVEKAAKGSRSLPRSPKNVAENLLDEADGIAPEEKRGESKKAPLSALAKLVAKAKEREACANGHTDTTLSSDAEEEEGIESAEASPRLKRPREAPSQVSDGDEPPVATVARQEAPGVVAKHPSQMTREEFLRQFKRAPRRGEIGQSAEEIEKAEALGYVMSGSRSKAAHLFVNRVQRQLHERDAAKREHQFRQVEDERTNARIIEELTALVRSRVKRPSL